MPSANGPAFRIADNDRVFAEMQKPDVALAVNETVHELSEGGKQALRLLRTLAHQPEPLNLKENWIMEARSCSWINLHTLLIALEKTTPDFESRRRVAHGLLRSQILERLLEIDACWLKARGLDAAVTFGKGRDWNKEWKAAAEELTGYYADRFAAPLLSMAETFAAAAEKVKKREADDLLIHPQVRFDLVETTASQSENLHADPLTVQRAICAVSMTEAKVGGTRFHEPGSVSLAEPAGMPQESRTWFFRSDANAPAPYTLKPGSVALFGGADNGNFFKTSRTRPAPGSRLTVPVAPHEALATRGHEKDAHRVVGRLSMVHTHHPAAKQLS